MTNRYSFIHACLLLLTATVSSAAEQLLNGDANKASFGTSIALAVGTLVVGAPGADGVQAETGEVSVYSKDANENWVLPVTLNASDANSYQEFGSSVAISNDGSTIVVGARGDDENGVNSGAVYIFEYISTTWVQTKLTAATYASSNDGFGTSVAISADGTTIVVGAPYDDDNSETSSGSLYVFTKSNPINSWESQVPTPSTSLVPVILNANDAVEAAYLGSSVSIIDNIIFAGAFGADAVYAFYGTNWVNQSKTTATTNIAGHHFGRSLAVASTDISEYNVFIGATHADATVATNSIYDAGVVYVFEYDAITNTWLQQVSLNADSDAETGQAFGSSISLIDGFAVIGARYSDTLGNNAGASFIFSRDDLSSEWTQLPSLSYTGADQHDNFGNSVAIIETLTSVDIVVAANGVDNNGYNAGAVIAYNEAFSDIDGDGFQGYLDNCVGEDNETQENSDGDIAGDACDAFINDNTEWLNSDLDLIGDNADAFPGDGTEWLDTDGDGTGNNEDLDDDNDGVNDDIELARGTDPLDDNDTPDVTAPSVLYAPVVYGAPSTFETNTTISGFCIDGDVVTAQINGNDTTPTSICVNNSYSITPVDVLTANSTYSFTVTATDDANNVSAASPATDLTIDVSDIDCSQTVITGVPQIECNALVAFYDATQGVNWIVDTNWKTSTNVNDWFGVTVTNGNVTDLSFVSNNLVGLLPAELGDLSNLQNISITVANLAGPIPSELGNLTNLQTISFFRTKLTGTIPPELGNLLNLQTLTLQNNKLTGTIPAALGNLANLQSLDLSRNLLTGALPTELSNPVGLLDINVSYNALSGDIPTSIATSPTLSTLNLVFNQFTFSNMEPSVSKMPTLLYYYQTELVDTTQSTNEFQGNTLLISPTIDVNPSGNDSYQWLKDGEVITGATSRDFTKANVSSNDSGVYTYKMTNVNLPYMALFSNPITVTVFDTLTMTHLPDNGLLDYDGATNDNNPGFVGQCISGDTINLLVNGSINNSTTCVNSVYNITVSSPLGDDTYSFSVELVDNGTSRGTTLVLETTISTGTLDCGLTSITGVSESECNALTTIYNATSGSGWNTNTNWVAAMPVSGWHGVTVMFDATSGLNKITKLDLSQNNLVGNMPAELSDLPALTHLFLQSNKLTGVIPVELNQTNLPVLNYLYVSDNELTGTLPFDFAGLDTLHIANNSFSFADIEPRYVLYSSYSNFTYSPQTTTVGYSCLPCADGNGNISITASFPVNGNDLYQWERNGVDIAGATTRDYNNPNANNNDIGIYRYRVTNNQVPGLSFISTELDIQAGSIDTDLVNHFVTTWKTDTLEFEVPEVDGTPVAVSSDQYTVRIPTLPSVDDVYAYYVDWNNDGDFDDTYQVDINSDGDFLDTIDVDIDGDLVTDYTVSESSDEATLLTGDVAHRFATAGLHTVRIKGEFPRIYFNFKFNNPYLGDKVKLFFVNQWGTQQWSSMEHAFSGAANLSVSATDIPDLSNVTSMAYMFYYAFEFNHNIGNWDVSNVTNMDSLLHYASSFDHDVSGWDVSNVTNMHSLFRLAGKFSQDLNPVYDDFGVLTKGWDVSSATNMAGMFSLAVAFNGDISDWNVSNVTNMAEMFLAARNFNQDIGKWKDKTSNVTSMSRMFQTTPYFDQDISEWNIENVTNMGRMFETTPLSTTNYDAMLVAWNNQNVQQNISFQAELGTYCNGADARQRLIDNFGWSFIDAGLHSDYPNCQLSQPANAPTSTNTMVGEIINNRNAEFDILCTGNDGNTVRLYINDVATSATAICANGTVTITAPTLVDGYHDISFTETNATGESPQSTTLNIEVDVADGDVNGDGQVNAADVLLVQQFILGDLVPDSYAAFNADVAPLINGIPASNNVIDAGDLLLIQRKALGSVDF